jgi:NADH-quinone oxidoreductase subunit L
MYAAIVFLPIIGSAIAGLLGRVIGARASEIVTTGLLFASAALSIVAFNDVALQGHHTIIQIMPWIHSGDFAVDWTIRVDSITAVMLVVVTGVSSLVHLYSIGYMADDPHRPRFFSFLSLFTFAMLMLVTANNFLQLFFGWEGVGLASYLLIGFWYTRPSANAAAIKAFIVNRVGDFGFALGWISTLCSRLRPHLRISNSSSPATVWTSSPHFACCCSWARWASRPRSGFTPGFPTPWKAPPRFRP